MDLRPLPRFRASLGATSAWFGAVWARHTDCSLNIRLPSSLACHLLSSRSSHLVLRSRCRCASEHTDGTDIFINVGPMDALTRPDNLEVLPLRWRRIGQTPRPREGDTDGTAVCERRGEEGASDLDSENPWIITRHSGHTMPPRCALSAPE